MPASDATQDTVVIMQRGSLFAAVLSVVGAVLATAVVASSGNVSSMYTAIAVILAINAVVRFRLARSEDDFDR